MNDVGSHRDSTYTSSSHGDKTNTTRSGARDRRSIHGLGELRVNRMLIVVLMLFPTFPPTYGLFTLHGTGIGDGTRNETGTIGNNGSWYMSWTNVNISVSYIRIIDLVPGPCPNPFPGSLQCDYTITFANCNRDITDTLL